jgi:hypothetical protein
MGESNIKACPMPFNPLPNFLIHVFFFYKCKLNDLQVNLPTINRNLDIIIGMLACSIKSMAKTQPLPKELQVPKDNS